MAGIYPLPCLENLEAGNVKQGTELELGTRPAHSIDDWRISPPLRLRAFSQLQDPRRQTPSRASRGRGSGVARYSLLPYYALGAWGSGARSAVRLGHPGA